MGTLLKQFMGGVGGGRSWNSYWNTHNINIVIEGHSFMIPTGRPSINIVDRFEESEYYVYPTSGSSIAGIVAREDTTDAQLIAGEVNVLVVWIGVNDLSDILGDGTTEATALLSYVADRITAGWDVYVYTMTPSTYFGKGETFEAKRILFNAALRAYSNDKYNLLDTDTVTELDDSTDTLYYYDLLHLTWLGGEYAAELFFDALEAKYTADCMQPVETDVPMTLTLTSTGDGSGVATLVMSSSKDVLITLGDNAKFYSDAGGTLDESSTWTVTPVGGNKTRYIKCSGGEATMTFARNKIITWGSGGVNGWASSTNAPSISGDMSQFTNLTYLYVAGNNTLSGDISTLTGLTNIFIAGSNTISGSISNMTELLAMKVNGSSTLMGAVTNTKLTSIDVDASTNFSGDITGLTGLTFLNVRDTNTITGSLANKTSLTYLYMVASASCYGDIGGSGTAAMVNGITTLVLNSCGTITYTPGATWSNATVQILNSLTQTIISNMLIDMAVAGPTSKGINFNNATNASMADTAQGGIWGDFDGETSPSALATAYKNLIQVRSNTVTLNGITVPGISGDGVGFPAGFGDWYRS